MNRIRTNTAVKACALMATLTILAGCGAESSQQDASSQASPSSSPKDTSTPPSETPTESPSAPTPSTTATAANASGFDFSKMCPKVVSRSGIPTCTELYPSKPYLRLPADPTGTNGGVLGGFNDDGAFVSAATGKTYQMSPDTNPVYSYTTKNMHWDNDIYRATVSNGEVTSVTKVAQVSEEAALNRLYAGQILEGRMDVWAPDKSNAEGGQWSGNTAGRASTPVRVQLAASASNGALSGRILNATTSVRSSTGACLPSLSSLGTANPLFDGRTSSFELTRITGMHNPGEAMVVLTFDPGQGQGMATGKPNHLGSVPLLFGRYSLIPLGDVENHAGARGDGPNWWGLQTVKGGGGNC